MVKISDELKIRITPELDISNSAFQNQLKSLLSGGKASKIELTVSKINGAEAISKFKKELESAVGKININTGAGSKRSLKVAGSSKNEWQSIFKESVKAQTAKNVDLKPLNEQLRREEIEAQNAAKQIEATAKRLENQKAKLQQSYAKMFDSNSLSTKVQRLNQTASSLSNGNAEEVQKAKELKTELLEVGRIAAEIQSKAGINGENIVNFDTSEVKALEGNFKQLNLEIQKTENISKSGQGISSELSKAAVQANRLQKLINETNNSLRLNDRAKGTAQYDNIKSYVAEAEKLKAMADRGIAVDPAQIDRLSASIKVADSEIVKMGKDGETYGTKLSNQMEKLGVYFSASAIIMGAWNQAKEMVQNVIALDKAVTDLQIATGYTRDETKELLNTYNQMGKELGASTIDVAQSADTWLRQGYAVDETNTLIKNSMVLSKLGQIDSAEATKALTSSMKGYNVSVEDSIGIVDKFTAVDREAAVSAGYIATALAETATGARLAGVDINKVTGYIASIGEVTQDGAESVGNFLKTLFARMGNIKSGKLIDPESAENLSDVETVLSGLGIKLRTSGGEFRNFGEVLDEVAGKWDSYGSVNQRAIAVAFSGYRVA